VPLALPGWLKEPPVGVMLHRTPAESLVVPTRVSGCVTTTAARAGEIETVMAAGLTFRVSVTLLVCAGALESVTVKVSAAMAAVAVGVPEIAAVEGARVRPAGSAPEEIAHDRGAVPPVAASVAV
jgi:hypothetical protein